MTTLRPDPNEIRRALALFLQPGGVIEVRVPKTERDGTISGYFNDIEAAVGAVMQLDGKASAIYVTLNEVPLGALARAKNRTQTRAKSTTTDKDIVKRNWMLIDFDPVRPADISSSDAEHDAALETAARAAAELSAHGWPEPVVGDSGNGAHLLYRIDLPNDKESLELVTNVLKALAQRYDSPAVRVDTIVGNASRISKIYGTVARKGDSTDDRPHRLSRIVSEPYKPLPVAKETLTRLASELSPVQSPRAGAPSSHNAPGPFDVPAWLTQHGIGFRSPVAHDGGDKWVLEECPFDSNHKAPDAAVFRTAQGVIGFKCFHDSCGDKTWKDVRDLYEPNRPQWTPTPTRGHAGGVAPEALPAEPAPRVPTTDLDFRVAQAITAGSVDACYTPDLAQCFANAYIAGSDIEADAAERKLKAKYPDLNLTQFRKGVKSIREQTFRAATKKVPRYAWEQQLIRKKTKDDGPGEATGEVLACEQNARLYIENAPEWEGVLGYNEFTARIAVLKPPPAPLSVKAGDQLRDHHDTEILYWFQIRTGIPWNIEIIRRVVEQFAHQNTFHPVREMLLSLAPWDGVERLSSFLFQYCGVGPGEADETEEDPELVSYVSAAGERFMISAVARVFRPGCQVDHVLVLEGGEGHGKTSAVDILAMGWNGTMSVNLDSKEAKEAIVSGVWIFEFAELAILKRTSEVESAKEFITRRKESFRPAYGRHTIEYPRQCVFIATVNGDDYLSSADGKRRWWPVRCVRPFDLEGLKEVTPMLWAEALYKFQHGAIWHFDPDKDANLIATAKEEQAARVPDDPWREVTVATIAKAKKFRTFGKLSGEFVFLEQIIDALPAPYGVDRDRAANRISRVLKTIPAWKKVQVSLDDGTRPRPYYRPYS